MKSNLINYVGNADLQFGNTLDETGSSRSRGALGGNNTATWSARRDHDLTAISGLSAALSAGAVAAYCGAWHSEGSSVETMRRYIQGLDATNAQTAMDDLGTFPVNTEGKYHWQNGLLLPGTTKSLRLNISGTRQTINYGDALTNYIYCGVYFPAP